MKKHVIRFMTATLFAVVFTSCWALDCARLDGSGNVVSEERPVPVFNKVSMKGEGDVVLKRGGEQSVVIETDDNILPVIKTTVRNNRLVISNEKYSLNPTALTYYITVDKLNEISISGSGNVLGESKFISDDFLAKISGSGDVVLELDTIRLESRISGSGSMDLTGRTDFYDATISGSGEINAFDLDSKRVSVTIGGSGDCNVSASEEIAAKISGSGDILYKGRPRINSSISGSGSINSRR